MLKSEDFFVSRRGVAKFYQEYTYIVTYFFSLAGPRVAKHVKETNTCVYSPVPENGNGEIKMKREYVRSGPFRSSPVQLPFNALFLNGRPLYGSNGGTFFVTPTVGYVKFSH